MNRYIKKFKGLFAITIIFTILSGFTDVIFTLMLKAIIDKVYDGDLADFSFFCFKVIILALSMSVAGYVYSIISAYFTRKLSYQLKQDIYLGIQNIGIAEYRKKNTGYFISMINNDIATVQSGYFSTIIALVYGVSIFISALVATIKINPYLCLILVLLSLIPMVVPFLFNKTLTNYQKKASDEMANFTEKVKDVLNAFEIVKAFNIQKKIFDEFSVHNKKVELIKFKTSKIGSLSGTLSSGLMYLTYFLSLLISGTMAIKGVISVGSMVASVNLVGNIANPLLSLANNITSIRSTKLVRDKILKVIDYKSKDLEDRLDIDKFDRKIEFKNVDFSYDGKNKALEDINVTFEKDKKYAIVGNSGSGKSTLIKLLLNYYDNYMGNIYLDGNEMKSIKGKSLVNLISMIQQEVFIFDDTIKNNITLYREYDEKAMDDVLEKMNLKGLIQQLDDGLETNMGENGGRFSGGQKQRVALARALIKKSPIIVLDESTGSLDNDTSYKIEKSLLNINDLTLISITHKLIKENLKLYDEIIYMKDGKIVEQGSFQELMNKKGYFYSLYTIQG